MLKSRIVKFIKEDIDVSKIKIGHDKRVTMEEEVDKISRKLSSLKSDQYRDSYLRNELKLGYTDRERVLSFFRKRFDMDEMVELVLQFRDNRSKVVFLKRKGFSPKERDEILTAAGPRRVDAFVKQKDVLDTKKPFVTSDSSSGSVKSLTKEQKGIRASSSDAAIMKFREGTVNGKYSTFAGGSTSVGKTKNIKEVDGGSMKGVKPVGF